MKTPDWKLWLGLSKIEAREALLLSLNICPKSFDSLMGYHVYDKSWTESLENELYTRQRLLEDNLRNPNLFPPQTAFAEDCPHACC